MTNNDILRSLRYILNVNEAKLVEIAALAHHTVSRSEFESFLLHDEDEGYRECPDVTLAHFLNGLVIYKRGADPARPPQPLDLPITNNVVLKKIRVAFELKDTDLIRLIEKSGVLKITKSELGSFFRSRDHRNYRECGDQYLRNVLKALAI